MSEKNLPAIPDAGDTEVLTGEIVGQSRPRVTAVVLGVVRHEHVRRSGRHASYIATGAYVLAKRAWEGRTTGRYERWLRGAEATGDIDRILEVEDKLARFRKDRHQRRMDWAELPLKYIVLLPTLAIAAVGILMALGVLMAIATHHIAEVVVPIETVARVVEWVVIIVSIAWAWMLLTALVIVLVML